MEEKIKNILNRDARDIPIDLFKEDLFLTKGKAEEIVKYITENWETLNTNNSIAIKGSWGSGKSSIIETWKSNNLFDRNLYELIEVDAWIYEGDLDLKVSIMQSIYSNADKNILGKAINSLQRYTRGIGEKLLDKAAEKIHYDRVVESSKISEYNNLKKCVKELNNANDKRKIVVIDNVDRLSPSNLVLFLNSIKYLFGIFSEYNVVFIVLIDEKYMLHSFKEFLKLDEKKATEFTSKIFARTFEVIPRMNLKNFVNINQENLSTLKRYFSNNPRNILKFFNIFDQIFGISELENTSDEVLFKIYIISIKLLFPLEAIKLFEPELNEIELNSNITFNFESKEKERFLKLKDRFTFYSSSNGWNVFSDDFRIPFIIPAPNKFTVINKEPIFFSDILKMDAVNPLTKDFVNNFRFQLKIEEMYLIIEKIVNKI